ETGPRTSLRPGGTALRPRARWRTGPGRVAAPLAPLPAIKGCRGRRPVLGGPGLSRRPGLLPGFFGLRGPRGRRRFVPGRAVRGRDVRLVERVHGSVSVLPGSGLRPSLPTAIRQL